MRGGLPASGRGRWQATTRCYQLKRIFLLDQKQIRFHHFVLTAGIEKTSFESVKGKAFRMVRSVGRVKAYQRSSDDRR